MDGLGARYTVPADVRVVPVDANGVAAEWTGTPAADPARVIMFLHGGGYMAGSIASHRHMIAQAGREAGARTFALDYRLAPEHPFPAALEDSLAGYRYLLDQGYKPHNIVVAGESAGGGLAVATLVAMREEGLPMPACTWCSSPWVDLEMSGSTMVTQSSGRPDDPGALFDGVGCSLFERCRSARAYGIAHLRRSSRAAAHADPVWICGDIAR